MSNDAVQSEPTGRTSDDRQPERLPQPCTTETSAPPHYRLHGRFVSGQTFYLSPEIVEQLNSAPDPAPNWPHWYSSAAFSLISLATLCAMCAIGRAGA